MTQTFETLAAGVHAVAIGDDLAILDTRTDAYVCLPAAGPGLSSTADSVTVRPGRIARDLRRAGFLGPDAGRRRLPPGLPVRTIIHDVVRASPGVTDVLKAAGACRDVRRARAAPGLQGFLSLADVRMAPSREETVIAAAARFQALSPWLPVEGECLVRSALLVSWLRRHGLGADWVFAVRLWPFAAHCWVQCGEVCLNDDVERLAAYTPIMVT